MENKEYIFVKNSLKIETNVIGYRVQGESILFFIKVDENVCFSGLIDCYCYNNINVIDDILREKKVKHLDFVCWTHPDLDHSKGFDSIFDKYVNNKTIVWIPYNTLCNAESCSLGACRVFNELRESLTLKNPKYNVYAASDYNDMLFYEKNIIFSKDIYEYPLNIYSFTPNSRIMNSYEINNKFVSNDCSIMLMVQIGSIINLFTGDVENTTINAMNSSVYFDNLHVMKIPHHGSDTSDSMLNIFSQCQVACSTVYRVGKSQLPLIDILKRYSKKSDKLCCTGNIDLKNEKYEYGVISIETDIVKENYGIELVGNAQVFSEAIPI